MRYILVVLAACSGQFGDRGAPPEEESATATATATQPTTPTTASTGIVAPTLVNPTALAPTDPQPGTPVGVGNSTFDDQCAVTWNSATQELLITVCQINNIYRWRAGLGYDIVRPVGEFDDWVGTAVMPNGDFLVAESKAHRITRSAGGYNNPQPWITDYEGDTFNTPTHLVVRSDSTVYFVDAPPENGETPMGYVGVFRVDPQGTLHLATVVDRAVGLVLSYDQHSLFVNTMNRYSEVAILRFPVAEDGTLGSPTTFVDFDPERIGAHGLCADQAGNVFHAMRHGGVQMYNAAGAYIGAIDVPGANDCAFGGADMKTMYVTTSSSLATDFWAVPMNIPGLP